ncbi:MAG: hypothetical protein QME93_06175 [Bacillota bacterium]|nr:hypothetical protein [Bacillota bacterium]MDI7249637.1 hypothetical protein [Bacillota bacterium]
MDGRPPAHQCAGSFRGRRCHRTLAPRPLGAHLVGPHAGELVSQVAGMMQAEATILEWEKVIHPHPTLSEAIGEAVAMAAHQMRAGAGR